jgi:uncharacterized protein
MKNNPILFQLLLLIALIGTGALVGFGLIYALGFIQGLEVKSTIDSLDENSPLGVRNFVRIATMLNHLTMFVAPALLFGILLYRNEWKTFFKLKNIPNLTLIILSILMIWTAFPLIQYFFMLNKALPLPDWMRSMEANVNSSIKGLLHTEQSYEFWFNLCIIALIPAVGEELIFRGVGQQLCLQYFKKEPHLAIWLVAAIFSAIHGQFEGFFPRMLLGAILGYVFYWSQNLWVSIAAHFANNAIQIILQHLYMNQVSKIDLEKTDGVPWWGAAISLGLVCVLGKLFLDKAKGEISKGV